MDICHLEKVLSRFLDECGLLLVITLHRNYRLAAAHSLSVYNYLKGISTQFISMSLCSVLRQAAEGAWT